MLYDLRDGRPIGADEVADPGGAEFLNVAVVDLDEATGSATQAVSGNRSCDPCGAKRMTLFALDKDASQRRGLTPFATVTVPEGEMAYSEHVTLPVCGLVYDLEFQRPAYLPVLAVLLVVFVVISSVLALLTQPIDGLMLGVGGLILAICGVRSVLVPSSLEAVTAVDLALSGAILLLLIVVAVRAALHLHHRTGLRLPRLRQRA